MRLRARHENAMPLILLNKPFRTLSQFSDDQGRRTLADILSAPNYRAAGRLDYDSEGLLVLTDNGQLQQQIANPRHKLWKTYWVQVEGIANAGALQRLREGLLLKDGPTRPARAAVIDTPEKLWPRNPPVRERKTVPDSWLSISICEGRNRQVRRMTAAVGLPTLRLIRVSVGAWQLGDLQPGQWRTETVTTPPVKSARKRSQKPPARRHRPTLTRRNKRSRR